MLFDYSKLRGRIVEKIGSQYAFAAMIKMSEKTLSLKINNKVAFTQDEICRILRKLEIP